MLGMEIFRKASAGGLHRHGVEQRGGAAGTRDEGDRKDGKQEKGIHGFVVTDLVCSEMDP